jgi:hypothetical protein
MLRAVLAAVLVLLAGPAPAQGIAAEDQAAVQGIIAAQLDAFRRDDGSLAYSFAAPGIKLIFPTVEVFMAMVREGYAPVYRSREVEFREVEPMAEGWLRQHALIIGADGRVVLALYTMERQPDGSWAIAGCTLVPAAEAAA